MKRVVIGVGNPSRGDDAVGLVVAQRLRARLPEEIAVIHASGDPAGLLAAWNGADLAVLVDAIKSTAAPGTVLRIEAAAEPVPSGLWCSSHVLGVGDAIGLGRALGQLPPRLIVFGIEGARFELGRSLSAAVAGAIPAVVARIVAELLAR